MNDNHFRRKGEHLNPDIQDCSVSGIAEGVCVSVVAVDIASVYKAGTLPINEKTEANRKGDCMLDVTTVGS